MDIQHLRHSSKVKWLLYYRQNRPWLVRLQIWGTYDGQRRPSSSFILATLSNLEPELTQMFPFIIALSSNPDQIVAALGLNFNPDVELKLTTDTNGVTNTNANGNGVVKTNGVAETDTNGNGLSMQILSSVTSEVSPSPSTKTSNLPSWVDESCTGKGSFNAGLVLPILAAIGALAVVFVGPG